MGDVTRRAESRAGRGRAAEPAQVAVAVPVPVPVPVPGPRWRRWVLVAPGLALVGVVLLLATALVDDRHGERASALCHHLPVPWTLFATAWMSLVCGVAAVVVCVLFFRAARRAGQQGAECWQGTLAVCICAGDALALLFEAVAVYGVHAEAGEPYWSCAGARVLGAVLGG
ncbi:hypothetical protein [Actinacidiphila acidipaludis]|uniref:Uncharacterized protein n=1 Tax=Actinacidiphila acidipaludis TaxID=2873382 RepID=A0ABS7Q544_9ACTN|nr:hypothetical protein [Streptomyces acidipaludis]MBY8876884.1 hypothetical protein [Streptomyces acidipaludis]